MDLKRIRKLINDQDGFELREQGSGHHGVYRQGHLVSVLSKSPRGGRRSEKNALAQLRRAGLKVPR